MTKKQSKLSELKTRTKNTNKHTERGVALLTKSIQKNGIADGITVAADGESISGSARLEVLADSMPNVKIQIVETYGDTLLVNKRMDIPTADSQQALQLETASNMIASADWNPDGDLLAALSAEDDYIAQLVKNDDRAAKAMLEAERNAGGGNDAEPQIDEDRIAVLNQKWGVKNGDIFSVGRHRVMCGDSLIIEDVKKLMGNEVPDIVIADPPYGVNIVAANVSVGGGEAYDIPFGGRKNLGSVGAAKPFGSKENRRGTDGAAHVVNVGKYAPIIGDETTDTAIKASSLFLSEYPDAVQVWWGANYYADTLKPSQCWLVWNKETTGNFADCELAWTNQDKAARLFTHRWNGMLRDSERERRWHPTQKPAALAQWILETFTSENAIAIDPFAGAGWCVLAAQESNRTIRVMEKSPDYCCVIFERMTIKYPGIEIERIA